MPYITYILYSPGHDIYYVGYTPNIERRLLEHNVLSEKSFTSKYRPWELFVSISFEKKSSALMAEKYLKKKPREFIKRLHTDSELFEYVFKKFNHG